MTWDEQPGVFWDLDKLPAVFHRSAVQLGQVLLLHLKHTR